MSPVVSAGGTPLPQPRADNPFEMEYLPIGAEQRMADGTLRVQVTALKWQARVFWHGLSAAERSTVLTAYGNSLLTPTAWVFGDGTTLTCMAGIGSWAEGERFYAPHLGQWLYSPSFLLKEV